MRVRVWMSELRLKWDSVIIRNNSSTTNVLKSNFDAIKQKD